VNVVATYRRVLSAGRWWFVATVLLFLGACVLGYVFTVAAPELVESRFTPIADVLRNVGARVNASETPLGRAWPIFANNVRSVFIMLLGGLALGIWPALGTFINGLVVGIVAGLGNRISPLAVSPWLLFLTLAPHGVFELPALWLGGAWGMKLGLNWLLPHAAGQRNETFKRDARDACLVFVLAVALLLVAALVEGNITLAIARSLRG
jgi:stage II sporulation protein M